MPILKRPEDSVHRVLKRLGKAKAVAIGPVIDEEKKSQLVSKFEWVEENLQRMEGVLPEVKSVEEKLVESFNTFEREIDDDIFKDHEKFDEIVQKLDQVVEKIQSAHKFITSLKLQLGDATSSKENVQSTKVQRRRASEEWSQLVAEEILFRSEAMQSLRHNFEALPDNYQRCLLSLSIFPASCEIKKTPIIYWWKAEGLIANERGDAAEEVGDTVFQKLISRRLIRAIYKKNSPIIDGCTLLPWIHSMLISLARQAELFEFDDMGRPRDSQRHAFFMSGNQDMDFVNNGNGNGNRVETLVTVFNINQKYLSFKADWLSKCKKVVVLHLGRWQISPLHHIEIENEESLKGLRALKDLRYLSLRGMSRVFTLPHSVSELTGLEILDLRACHNLEELSFDISSLRNLTHLDISECYLLESMPKGVEELTKLQVLKGFVVGKTSKDSCKISDLEGLRELRKLAINIGTKAVVEEPANLEKMESLRKLTISWGAASSPPTRKSSFVLPTGLKKLDLRFIQEDTLPEWVDLRKLTVLEKLYIRGGQLQSLRYDESDRLSIKTLRLKYLKHLTVRECDLKRMLPDADYFEAINCQGGDISWRKK